MKRTMNDTLNEKTKRPTDCYQIKSNTQNSLTISQSFAQKQREQRSERDTHSQREMKKNIHESNVYYYYYYYFGSL